MNSFAQPFTDINANLITVENGVSKWGDVDNDGDLDLIVTGDADLTTLTSLSTRIYVNDGSGTFTQVDPGIPGTFNGSIDWGDIDGDGDLDVVITGNTSGSEFAGEYFSAVYRNDGVPNFTQLSLTIPQVSNGSSEWGDYDGDGDLDLIVTGIRDDQTPTSAIYRNDGGTFTDIGAFIARVENSSSDWGDYDSDNDLDLLLTGLDENDDLQTRVYRNDGANGFIDIGAGLPGIGRGTARWGDLDADGDLDIVISGLSRVRNGEETGPSITEIYVNNGEDTFATEQTLFGVEESDADWADIDQDGDLDLAIRGSRSTLVYRNDGPGGFIPIGSRLPTSSDNESVRWGDIDGDGDPDLILTGRETAVFENVRDQPVFRPLELPLQNLGETASVASADYDSDGDPDFVITGVDENQDPSTKLYRNDGAGSFSEVDAGLLNFARGSATWADYDGDGDADLLLTGISERLSAGDAALYRNNGNSSFTEIATDIAGIRSGAAAWGDYDEDGDLDLVITGERLSLGGFFALTQLLKNEEGTLTTITTDLRSVRGDVQWGDYDSDGDLDVIMSDEIYQNDGNDTFVLIDSGLIDLESRGASGWGDYDGDGDLDLFLSSQSGTPVAKVYRNNGTTAFTDIRASITDVRTGNGEWADYDGDGDLDLLLIGEEEGDGIFSTSDKNLVQAFLYQNDGSGTFTRAESGIAGVLGDLEWRDFDQDGDLDLLTVGSPLDASYGQATRLYVNQLNPVGATASAEVRTDQAVVLPGTGVEIRFAAGTTGSGFVHVRRFDVTPNQTNGIPESFTTSRYRVLIEADPTVTVGAGTEVRFDPSAFGGISNAETIQVFRRSTSRIHAPGQFVEVTTSNSPQNGQITALVDGFSEFVFASDDASNPLPVELTSFTSTNTEEGVVLNWATASETNNAGFEIQRQQATSSPELSWERIGFVEGAGTTDEPQSYRFRDTAPLFADSLVYRLRQIDTDGTEAFSDPVVIRQGLGAEVQLATPFPNPVRQQATVRYIVPEGEAQPVRLQVYNLLGQRVATLVDEAKAPGREEIILDASRWASGTYFLRLQVGGVTKTQRLTVVR